MRAVICLVLIAIALPLATADEPATSASKIERLHAERVSLLQQSLDAVLALQKVGAVGGGLEQVHQARIELLRAKLDAAKTRQERIKIHGELVAEAAEWVESVGARFREGSAGASGIDLLRAKAYHLETQIALEQAKAGN